MDSSILNQSEPTTGEISETLRQYGEASDSTLFEIAADRLESQEKEIDAKTFALSVAKELQDGQERTIAALTARAEQAEKERDAAINALTEYEDALYPTVEDMMRDLNTL